MILSVEIIIDFNHVMVQISPDRQRQKQLILVAATKQDNKTVGQQDGTSFDRREHNAKGNKQNFKGEGERHYSWNMYDQCIKIK